MKKAIFASILLSTAAAGGQSISAKLASGKIPKATFEHVHQAFTRVVLNESGWSSKPDANGILGSVLSNTGGRKKRFADTYGLDCSRVMSYLAAASLRTFPPTDPWAEVIMESRYSIHGEMAIANHVEQQHRTDNTYWTSSFNMDCSEPDHWSEVYPALRWKEFEGRCTALVEMTRVYLQGKEPNWCRTVAGDMANPRYWGNDADAKRVEKENWEELICDEPGASCTSANRKDPNNKNCARNRWFREFRSENVRQ